MINLWELFQIDPVDQLKLGQTLWLVGTTLVCLLVFTLLVVCITRCIPIRGVYSWYSIPGPSMPVAMYQMYKAGPDKMHEVMLRWTEKYGPMYTYTVLNPMKLYTSVLKQLVITDAGLVKYVLKENVRNYETRPWTTIQYFNPNAFPNGDWKVNRGLCEAAVLAGNSPARYMQALIDSCYEQNVKLIKSRMDSDVDLGSIAGKFASNGVGQMVFTADIRADGDHPAVLGGAPVAWKLMGEALPLYLVKWWPVTKQYQHIIDHNRDYVYEQVERHCRERSLKDVLSYMMERADEAGTVGKEQFADVVIDLVGAAIGQLDPFFAFIVYDTAAHPDCQAKLRAEVLREVGSKGAPTVEQLRSNALPYLDNFVRELLRRWQSLNGRLALKDDVITFNGRRYHIPANAIVSIDMFTCGLNAKVYPNPLEFNPDRWSDVTKEPDFNAIPFGFAPRTCLGAQITVMAMKASLIAWVQHAVLHSPSNNLSPLTDIVTIWNLCSGPKAEATKVRVSKPPGSQAGAPAPPTPPSPAAAKKAKNDGVRRR